MMSVYALIYVLGMVTSYLIIMALWFCLLKPIYSRIWILIISICVVIIFSVIKVKSPPTNSLATVVVPLLSIICIVASAVICFEKAVLVVIISLCVLSIAAEFSTRLLFYFMGIQLYQIDLASPEVLYGVAMTIGFEILYFSLIVLTWHKFALNNRSDGVFCYILYIINQLFWIVGYTRQWGAMQMTESAWFLLGMVISGSSDILFFMMIFLRKERDDIVHKVSTAERLLEQEKEYYQMLEGEQEKYSRLRHDWNNYLSVLYNLLEADNSRNEMVKILKDFQDMLMNKRV